MQLRQCSACQSVWYCSVRCQKGHWPEHKVLCKAIKELSERENHKEKGLGDSQDENAYVSHITPRQQDRVPKLVGRKCSVQCYLNDEPAEVLWDTGAQVSIVAENFLKSQLPAVQVKDIQQLLGTDVSINLQAANGTDIPYCGWAEVGVKLADDETQIRVPFLVTKENIEQPIIGFNVIELIVKETDNNAGGDKLVERITNSFRLSKNSDIPALVNLIRTKDSNELCLVKSAKKTHDSCRTNSSFTSPCQYWTNPP